MWAPGLTKGETQEMSEAQRILRVTGAVSLLAALAFGTPVAKELFSSNLPGSEALTRPGPGVALLCAYGITCLGLSLFELGRVKGGVALACSVLFSVLFGFEALARPFVPDYTTIFQEDADLGWRLRPEASDDWLGVDVSINSLGMRDGIAPKERSTCILFLGDSVTFGAFLERDAQTIPAMAQARLAGSGREVACLNGGVGGWSTWQQEAWLLEVAETFKPKLVVINAVLNDATESLRGDLGRARRGFQLARSIKPGLFSETTWGRALRFLRRSYRGDEIRDQAARESELGVYELLRSPEMPASRAAWAAHLEALGDLVETTKAIGATPVVVAHPYTVQFEVPELWWPQRSYESWCKARDVAYIDGAKQILSSGESPGSCYHDGVHPNKKGAALLGAGVADELLKRGLVP